MLVLNLYKIYLLLSMIYWYIIGRFFSLEQWLILRASSLWPVVWSPSFSYIQHLIKRYPRKQSFLKDIQKS